jgi:hypothetical protein
VDVIVSLKTRGSKKHANNRSMTIPSSEMHFHREYMKKELKEKERKKALKERRSARGVVKNYA